MEIIHAHLTYFHYLFHDHLKLVIISMKDDRSTINTHETVKKSYLFYYTMNKINPYIIVESPNFKFGTDYWDYMQQNHYKSTSYLVLLILIILICSTFLKFWMKIKEDQNIFEVVEMSERPREVSTRDLRKIKKKKNFKKNKLTTSTSSINKYPRANFWLIIQLIIKGE